MIPLDVGQIEHGRMEFLAILAHELRNPLAVIDHAVEILGVQTTGSSAVEHSRTLIKRQLRQMLRLTDDLLDVARVGTGKLTLQKKCIDLASVIGMATESLQRVIDGSHHTLITHVPSCAVYVDADPMRMAQVVINLVDNSAKYSDRYGRIMVSLVREAGEAVIRVRDEGIGISADALPYVFDLFVQGEHSMERSRGGLGVGLNLVKCIVELHNGSVEAHSDGPGAGSEFIVRIPAACR